MLINPLIEQPPSEVPLKNAPLIRVLAQVRFPPILKIEDSISVAPFQEAIREKYPILQSDQGIVSSEPQKIWRFADVGGNWRVSLTRDFVALETDTYLSRSDFLERWENVLEAVDEHINPKIVERFGLRYIDRLVELDTKYITRFVRPEVAGILSAEFGEYVHQAISEYIFSLPEGQGQLLARWGLLPPNTTIDPTAVEPIAQPSWILDLDTSFWNKREFSVKLIMSEAQRFAERIYTFFRWAVTDEFLRHFGGEL